MRNTFFSTSETSPVRRARIQTRRFGVDQAKTEFKALQQLYEKVDRAWVIATRSGQQPQRAIKFYEVAIPLSNNWILQILDD